MSSSALVIGGTGPTGPTVIRGLLDGGWDVTILHGGQHEIDDLPPVPHIHADPHFAETLAAGVAGQRFDLVVAQYGRLRAIGEVFAGRTERLIAIGASTAMAANETSPRWGPLGRPAVLRDPTLVLEDDPTSNKLYYRIAEAYRDLFEHHAAGHFIATYLGYPVLYGPRQPGPQDWCILRRALDRRPTFVVADGGIKLETRGYTLNVARSVMLAVDQPDVASGQAYVVADRATYTMRQRIDFVAAQVGHRFDYIDLPYQDAAPCHPLWRHDRGHRVSDSTKAREELGYNDHVPVEEAWSLSVEWLLRHRPEPGGPVEQQIGDPFDYRAEDALVGAARTARRAVVDVVVPVPTAAHIYRHPKRPGEAWSRPDGYSVGSSAPTEADGHG